MSRHATWIPLLVVLVVLVTLLSVGEMARAATASLSRGAAPMTAITLTEPTLALTLNKEVSADGSTWFEDIGPVVVGTLLTYRYTVSSASNVPLAVDITDDSGTPADTSDDLTVCTVADLQPGASATCTVSEVPAAFTGSDMNWTNLATAKGCVQTDCASATDTASYSGQYWAFDPGFWRAHGPDAPSGNDAWSLTNYDTTLPLGEVFNPMCMTETPRGSKKPLADYTLLEALAFKGGPDVKGAKGLLLRAAVASLLNASFHEKQQGGLLGPNGEVYFPYSTTGLVDVVNEALCWPDPGTARQTMTHLMNELQNYNKGISYIDWSNPANPPPLPSS